MPTASYQDIRTRSLLFDPGVCR